MRCLNNERYSFEVIKIPDNMPGDADGVAVVDGIVVGDP